VHVFLRIRGVPTPNLFFARAAGYFWPHREPSRLIHFFLVSAEFRFPSVLGLLMFFPWGAFFFSVSALSHWFLWVLRVYTGHLLNNFPFCIAGANPSFFSGHVHLAFTVSWG